MGDDKNDMNYFKQLAQQLEPEVVRDGGYENPEETKIT